jgi:hypothetical protein
MTPEEITEMLHKAEVTKDGPRAWTKEEMRERLFRHIWSAIDFWAKEAKRENTRDLLSGVVHSVLALLDGSAIGAPGMAIIPFPHKDDEAYHKANGENWWPRPEHRDLTIELHDIGGSLHEELYRRDPSRVKTGT